MTLDEWNDRFRYASHELLFLSGDGLRTGDDVTNREGELLNELDELQFVAGVKSRQVAC